MLKHLVTKDFFEAMAALRVRAPSKHSCGGGAPESESGGKVDRPITVIETDFKDAILTGTL